MDLIRQKEAWKRAVKELRLIFQNLETEFRKDLQGAWRVHWDHQLQALTSTTAGWKR